MSTPLLSVWCSAYNHQKYIAQALEGFLMQETDFEIEIFIHDDASTDNTADIIREYAAKHPHKIKPIYQKENKYSVDKAYLNRIMFQKVRGKYIALCEGDDYWTDPLKLQKQVNFLEANPDFAISFHRVEIIYDGIEKSSKLSNLDQKEITTFEDLAGNNFIYTLSYIFRNNLFGDLPSWFAKMPVGDYPLHLLNAQYGKIKFFEEVMGVYRIHSQGAWGSRNYGDMMADLAIVNEQLYQHFYPRGRKQFGKELSYLYKEFAFYAFNDSDYTQMRRYYRKLLRFINMITVREALALTVRYFLSYMPPVANLYKRFRK